MPVDAGYYRRLDEQQTESSFGSASALAPLWQPSGRHDAPARPMHADAEIPIPSRKCFLALRSFPATTARREGGVPRNTHPRVCRHRALTMHEGTPADSGSALSRSVEIGRAHV